MQKFEYRTPRYLVDLPVRLNLQNGSVAGKCREIGNEGMRVEFKEPVSADTCGTVCINYRDLSLELRVSVAHAVGDYKGLKFLFESEKDRMCVERLVLLLAGSAGQPGPVLVR